MSRKHLLLKGAFILTLTGFATRFMGFFFRIFLSHTFGEEGVGLYQLIFPVYALCFSLTCSGIQTALSRCVAGRIASGREAEARELLRASILLTLTASCCCALFLQRFSGWIAQTFLQEPRCAQFLVILSYAFPFAALHSCIVGYYLGRRSTRVPAVSQLIEQAVRILSVFLFCQIGMKIGAPFGISVAVAGLVMGAWSWGRSLPLPTACRCSVPGNLPLPGRSAPSPFRPSDGERSGNWCPSPFLLLPAGSRLTSCKVWKQYLSLSACRPTA